MRRCALRPCVTRGSNPHTKSRHDWRVGEGGGVLRFDTHPLRRGQRFAGQEGGGGLATVGVLRKSSFHCEHFGRKEVRQTLCLPIPTRAVNNDNKATWWSSRWWVGAAGGGNHCSSIRCILSILRGIGGKGSFHILTQRLTALVSSVGAHKHELGRVWPHRYAPPPLP